jgi:general secretion pathway protein G
MKIRSNLRFGFTLMEIMLVMVIIGLLAAFLVAKNMGVIGGATAVAAQGLVRNVKTELMSYRLSAGHFPSTQQGLAALVSAPSGDPKPMMWRKIRDDIPKDPWMKELIYECPGRKNPDTFDLYSSGPDMQPGNADDVWAD